MSERFGLLIVLLIMYKIVPVFHVINEHVNSRILWDFSIHNPLCYPCEAAELCSVDSQSHNNVRIAFLVSFFSNKWSPNWPARSLYKVRCFQDKKQNFASKSLGITRRHVHLYPSFPCSINSWLRKSSAYIVHWYESYNNRKTAPKTYRVASNGAKTECLKNHFTMP